MCLTKSSMWAMAVVKLPLIRILIRASAFSVCFRIMKIYSEFEKYISDIYPAELQMNKANASDKQTSFLDLNIKVIGSDIHTSVHKRNDFVFPIVNFPWLSGGVPRLPSYSIWFTFRSWLELLGVVLAFWIFILKISKLLQNSLHRVIDITSFEKHLETSLDYTPNFCRNFVKFRSKNMNQKESLTRSSTLI